MHVALNGQRSTVNRRVTSHLKAFIVPRAVLFFFVFCLFFCILPIALSFSLEWKFSFTFRSGQVSTGFYLFFNVFNRFFFLPPLPLLSSCLCRFSVIRVILSDVVQWSVLFCKETCRICNTASPPGAFNTSSPDWCQRRVMVCLFLEWT